MKSLALATAAVLVLGFTTKAPRREKAHHEGTEAQMEGEKKGEVFQIEDVRRQWKESGREYFEFLRVPDMSAGLYVLGKGAEDRQSPHGEDEIYYVRSGKGAVRIDGRDYPVQAGSVVYVKAQVPHHFHSIEEELQILVVFAPAFGTK